VVASSWRRWINFFGNELKPLGKNRLATMGGCLLVASLPLAGFKAKKKKKKWINFFGNELKPLVRYGQS
jgi:hypothetical protein